MVKEIDSKEFREVIKNGKVVIDCYATWCGPCKMLSPVLEEIASELKETSFYKLDVDKNEEISGEYNIMSIPTILIFEDGKLSNTLLGLRSKEELVESFK